MLKTFFLTSCALKLQICFVLSCFVSRNCVSAVTNRNGASNMPDQYSNTTNYKEEPDWTLAPVGKSASDFLRIFFTYASTGAFRSTLRAGVTDYDKFVRSVTGYTFLYQVPMTIIASLGLLGALLLILMPCFIVLYRKRQTNALKDAEVGTSYLSVKQGWLIYEFISVFLAVAVFGGILMCLSSSELENKFHEGFDLALTAIEQSYQMKELIVYNFHYSLSDVSHSIFETIQVMYNVNDDIESRFINEINYRIKPVRFLATSIQWDVMRIENVLKFSKKWLQDLINIAENEIETLAENYLTTLKELKKVFDNEKSEKNFGSIVDPLLEISNFTRSNSSVDSFDESIERLENISKMDLQGRFQNATFHLRNFAANPNYDPSPIMEKLRHITYDIEHKIRSDVGLYITHIDDSFKEEDRFHLEEAIKSLKDIIIDNFSYPTVIVLIFSIISASLGILFFITYSLGVLGTRGFRISNTSGGGYKSGLSHGCGRVTIILIYITVVFLAFFWALSVFLFVMSAVPFEICLSTKDLSIFNVAMDSADVQGDKVWYSMYASERFNFTLRENIEGCAKDISFFSLLKDPVANESSFNDIKDEVDLSNVTETIEDAVQKLPNVSLSESEMSQLSLENILDIDINSYFSNMFEYLNTLTKSNASLVLNKIKNHKENSQKLDDAARAAVISYNALVGKLSIEALKKDTVYDTLVTANDTAQVVELQMEHFKMNSEILVDFLEQNTTDLYLAAINDSVSEMIDATKNNVHLSLKSFRKSLSVCPFLNRIYPKFVHVVCKRVLYPMSSCWMGSLFVDIFLLIAVILCLFSVPLFLIPPKKNDSDGPPDRIQPEDIPPVVADGRSISHVLTKVSVADDKGTSQNKDHDKETNKGASTSKMSGSAEKLQKRDEVHSSQEVDNLGHSEKAASNTSSSVKTPVVSSEPKKETVSSGSQTDTQASVAESGKKKSLEESGKENEVTKARESNSSVKKPAASSEPEKETVPSESQTDTQASVAESRKKKSLEESDKENEATKSTESNSSVKKTAASSKPEKETVSSGSPTDTKANVADSGKEKSQEESDKENEVSKATESNSSIKNPPGSSEPGKEKSQEKSDKEKSREEVIKKSL